MTAGRAAVLCLMSRYLVPGYIYRLSMLEIQKLAYFMQSAGQALKLNFEKSHFGPYADNLRIVLEKIDGHFIEGYGDGVGTNKPETPITLLADAASEAEDYLASQDEVQERFSLVADLIEGYETPYGMELLSSVHWVATRENPAACSDPEVATKEVQAWNQRKYKLLQPEHIRAAWQTLHEKGWLVPVEG